MIDKLFVHSWVQEPRKRTVEYNGIIEKEEVVPYPRATFAGLLNLETGHLYIGVSICSISFSKDKVLKDGTIVKGKRDQFDKRIGRTLALERAQRKMYSHNINVIEDKGIMNKEARKVLYEYASVFSDDHEAGWEERDYVDAATEMNIKLKKPKKESVEA